MEMVVAIKCPTHRRQSVSGSIDPFSPVHSSQFATIEMSHKRPADNSSEDDSDASVSSEDSLSSDSDASANEESSGDEGEIVNCDFEFFDPQKQDFLGIKHLLRQLFDADADMFNLDAFTEWILDQPLIGTTVKTDGNESDPLAILTVLNLAGYAVTSSTPLLSVGR
jgi:hypothetical protein